jgi:DNA polymerase elongation subunit (family B)
LAQQEIRIEDAMMVRKLSRSSGIDTAYQYMAVKRKKYFQEKMMMSQQEKDMETQRQLQMQQLSAQAKQQEQEMQMEIEELKIQGASMSRIAELREEYRLRSLLSEQEFEQNYQLEMVSDQGQIGKEKYKEDRKDQRAEQQAKLTAKQKVQVDKVKSGAQTEVNEDKIKGKDELQELIS